jgi:UPF0716 protein FxsA
VISSVLVLVGGVLLVTPGVVTDVTGLVLLLPWTRRLVANALRKRLERRFAVQPGAGGASMFVPFDMGDMSGMAGPRGPVIDVEAVEPQAHAERGPGGQADAG